MTVNLNQVALTGNLTRDPRLVRLRSGHVYCELQLACSHRSVAVTGCGPDWAYPRQLEHPHRRIGARGRSWGSYRGAITRRGAGADLCFNIMD